MPDILHDVGPFSHDTAGAYTISGYLIFDTGVPAPALVVRAYSRRLGGAAALLGETRSGTGGRYTIDYPPTDVTSVEMRVIDARGREVVVSEPMYQIATRVVVNLVVPQDAHPVASEFERVATDVAREIGGLEPGLSLVESEDRQDVTHFAALSGWDARVVAVAASASRGARETGIAPDALYGMFRAGLPTDIDQLAMTGAAAVARALRAASDASIVTLNPDQIKSATIAYQRFAANRLQLMRPEGALSTYGQMLEAAPLTAAEKDAFAQSYFAKPQGGADLWSEVGARVSQAGVKALQLQGKLSLLTSNNAALVASLSQDLGGDASALVLRDLYEAEAWKARLNAMAAHDPHQLDALIPPAYAGRTIEARLDAYVHDLARKVRTSYPTQVLARMVQKGDLPIGTDIDRASVHTFLNNAAPLEFRLGRVPISRFIADNQQTLFNGIAADQVEAVTAKVKTLQRLYQITPSNEALKTTMTLGFTSAHDIASIPKRAFIEQFGPSYASLDEADLVYRKAHQVSTVTLSFFAAAKQIQSSPPLFSTSAPTEDIDDATENLLKHYPTLESLFGSLDFCDCEECGSVLGPAAYFVDVLHFLDPKTENWQGFLSDWKKKHENAPYPFDDQAALTSFTNEWTAAHPGDPLPNTERTPYDVLIERRPDLPNLPLTCENTNVAMPYIDIANEILEFFVANGALTAADVYDTGDATTPELLAEPQNILATAYDKLKAVYPLTLPFDVWLETVRHFFRYFKISFADMLDLVRPSDDLFPPAASPKAYYRADIFRERLGLSPAEYQLYTDGAGLAKWFELFGYKAENEALAALKSGKTLADRIGVTYKELIDLVQTGFVNPTLTALVVLQKLDVDVTTVFQFKKHPNYTALSVEESAAFEQLLADLSTTYPGFDAKAWLDQAWTDGAFDEALVLAAPATGCDFGQTLLQYADGTPADAIVFLKLNLFVRLWRRLGWTIEEVDRGLEAFIPSGSTPLTVGNIGTALQSALVYLSHLKVLDDRFGLGAGSRSKLIVLWSNLSTTGKNALYPRLFLTRSILKTDAIFDDPLGNYLSAAGLKIADHLAAVQGALNLTAGQVGAILEDTKQDVSTAPLSIANLSLLYRYTLVAKALRLKVDDLIKLKQLSGLDPFRAIEAAPLTAMEQDHPFNQTLAFADLAPVVTASGFTIDDLRYLLRHDFDPVGKYRADDAAVLSLVRTLSAGVRQIERDQAPPADAATLTDEVLQQKLSLMLPADAVATLLAMWNGTIVREAIDPSVPLASQLDSDNFAAISAITVSYEAVRQAQHLTYRGFLPDTTAATLKSAEPSFVFDGLIDQIVQQQIEFRDKYLSAFLSSADVQQIFAPLAPGLSDAAKEAEITARRALLGARFLPYLQTLLTRQFVVSTLAAATGADPSLVDMLVTDAALLEDPTVAGKTLLDAFASPAKLGVDAVYYSSVDGSGAALASAVLESADTSSKPVAANSARFDGYFDPPTAGAWRFFAVLDKKDADATIRIDAVPDPIVQGVASADASQLSAFVELVSGVAYRVGFATGHLGGGDARLLVQGEASPKDTFAALTVYPATTVDRVSRAHVLLGKALQSIATLALNAREVKYLLMHGSDFGGLSFSQLPTQATSDPGTVLFQQFLRAIAYAALKRDLAGGGDGLIAVFENARHTYAAGTDPTSTEAAMLGDLSTRIAELSRRDGTTVQAIAKTMGMTATSTAAVDALKVEAAGFTNEVGIATLWAAMQMTERLGVPIDALTRWAVASPDDEIARDLRDTVKAIYTTENWQKIAQSIFDPLRQKRRDALVAYIQFTNGFESSDQLFEYFLVDPKMEPVVQTSRLRLAISSVQTFIQRCFLNLEPWVRPSALNADHWEWMKRYRIWGANREMFLFPENLLEPAFRDDKTSLYAEFETALTAGDVSDELAETALFGYLAGLDEIAKLQILTIAAEQDPADQAENILHVIGRTSSLPHKYFYRRYQYRAWTPWEPITAPVEGEHLACVVWRDRLQLFWLTFMDKPRQNPSGSTQKLDISDLEVPTSAPDKDILVQLNWAEYFQGAWTGHGASGFGDPMSVTVESTFDNKTVFVHATTGLEDGVETALVHVHFDGVVSDLAFLEMLEYAYTEAMPDKLAITDPALHAIGRRPKRALGTSDLAFKVVSRNSPPEIVSGAPPFDPPYAWSARDKSRYSGAIPLRVSYVESIKTSAGQAAVETKATKDLFTLAGSGASASYSLTTVGQAVNIGGPGVGSLVMPFFVDDRRHAFYVEPTLTEVTLEEWDGWALPPASPSDLYAHPDWFKNLVLTPAMPFKPPKGGDPSPVWDGSVDPSAKYQIQDRTDWLTDQSTAIQYGNTLVGRAGGLGLTNFATQGAAGLGSLRVIGSGGLASALANKAVGKGVVGGG